MACVLEDCEDNEMSPVQKYRIVPLFYLILSISCVFSLRVQVGTYTSTYSLSLYLLAILALLATQRNYSEGENTQKLKCGWIIVPT